MFHLHRGMFDELHSGLLAFNNNKKKPMFERCVTDCFKTMYTTRVSCFHFIYEQLLVKFTSSVL